MANTILNNIKLIICNDTTANWGLSTKVLSKGETAYEFKADGSVGIKIGDGVNTWADLAYATLTPAEIEAKINSLIEAASHSHSNKEILDAITAAYTVEEKALVASAIQPTDVATAETAGLIKVGSDFDVTEDGELSIYKAIAVSSFTLNGSGSAKVVEKGATVDSVVLAWAFNKVPVSATVDGTAVDATQSGSKTLEGLAITADKTFTVRGTDARNASANKSISINFRNGKYYGVSTVDNADAVDSAFIQSLSKNLVTGRTGDFKVTAGEGQYIFFAIPTSMGAASFKVGGFEGGFELFKTFEYENVEGHKENYYVYKSANANLGATTVTVL